MALDDILKKIKKEAEEKIKKIKEKTEQEVKKIEEKYQLEIEKKKNQILTKAKEEAEKKLKQEQIKILLETKNLLLLKKQEILENLYQEALNKLSNLDDEDYLKLILNLIKKCPAEGEIIPAKGREKITQRAILESKRNYTLSNKSKPIKGGFIFSSKNIEIDNSFENLIKIIREKTEIKLAKIIFG